ncbi:MAG: hypothetical protein ACLFML_05765, partial [Desulfobacterales bacterium]
DFMESDARHVYAVITGDFIGFSGTEKNIRKSMPDVMARAGGLVQRILPGVMEGAVDVFRGDSWQALIKDPVYSLRTALVIRAFARSSLGSSGLDMRAAIGVGPVDYVQKARVSAGDGAAFRRSGKMLEKMSSSRNAGLLRYSFPDLPQESLVDALVRTAGALGCWRPLQARAVIGVLEGKSRPEIAESWPGGISRQAVSAHLKNAQWPALLHALEAFEHTHRTTL